jgi:hypothetical protein
VPKKIGDQQQVRQNHLIRTLMSSTPPPKSLPWWSKETRLRACLSYSTSGSGVEGGNAESFCSNSSMARVWQLRRLIDDRLL